MNKKYLAIVLELIPVISAVASFTMIFSNITPEEASPVIGTTMLLAFLGFVFSFVGRKLAKQEKVVRVLGVLDLLATLSVVGLYVLVFLALAG